MKSDFIKYKKRQLFIENVAVADIVKKTGTPLYIYSIGSILNSVGLIKQNLAKIEPLICFAAKANSNRSILKLLGDTGLGADIVSGGELFRALEAGIDPQKIVFSGVGKTLSEIKEALRAGIFSFNIESKEELGAINEAARSLKQKARIALRYNPDVNPKTHPYISTGLKENKFGLTKSEILQIAKEIQKYRAVLFSGLSIHIGSQILTLGPIKQAFDLTSKLVDELNKILPAPLSFVDLGGGLGVRYSQKDPEPKISKYCELIIKFFGDRNKIRVVLEPGRLISANAGILVTKTVYRKKRGSKDFLIVDAGMNDLLRPALYASYHEIVPVMEKHKKSKTKPTDVVGPICESSDCFGKNRPIPITIKSGDLLAILSTGAYAFSMSSQYNSRPRAAEVLVQNKKHKLVRLRESYADLIRGEVI